MIPAHVLLENLSLNIISKTAIAQLTKAYKSNGNSSMTDERTVIMITNKNQF